MAQSWEGGGKMTIAQKSRGAEKGENLTADRWATTNVFATAKNFGELRKTPKGEGLAAEKIQKTSEGN